ncbi:MAG: UDP-N-acetylglucosamine diphosphorylase [Verrucomicrobiales bacterium]|nr:UDP-N-acetylglucosamine diphosphorylase [Verrucomicrobiales bacterium]
MSEGFAAKDYLDFSGTAHADLFDAERPAWEALGRLEAYIDATVVAENHGTVIGQAHIGERVQIGEGTVIDPGAVIMGPAVIGKNCTIRSGCYVRENVIVGDSSYLGNSSEFKNCILFDETEVPHFNYVGDSVMGYRAHLGAGVILANFRLDRDLGGICIPTGDGVIETGLDKMGAIIGDRTDIGSNSVVSPGSVIGRDCRFYPGTHWRGGVLPHRRIVKVRQTLEIVERR